MSEMINEGAVISRPEWPRDLLFMRFLAALEMTTVMCLGSVPASAADTIPVGYVITIENVELKDSFGNWVSVIRPDKQVDLTKTEAAVSFFNTAGRVPPASYDDFRVEFLRPDGEKVRLSTAEALEKPLRVEKGSFIRVCFDLEVDPGQEPALQAKKAAITVDGRTEEMEKLKWS